MLAITCLPLGLAKAPLHQSGMDYRLSEKTVIVDITDPPNDITQVVKECRKIAEENRAIAVLINLPTGARIRFSLPDQQDRNNEIGQAER